jgi:hypothetical protein
MSVLRNGGPQAAAIQLFQNNFSNNIEMQNLIQMAQNGDSKGIQRFAQDFFNQHGRNFNNELQNFMRLINGG